MYKGKNIHKTESIKPTFESIHESSHMWHTFLRPGVGIKFETILTSVEQTLLFQAMKTDQRMQSGYTLYTEKELVFRPHLSGIL